jgi:cytidyltransferase-like protein
MSKHTGAIVGRFQVPYLHAGHLNLIATALRECDQVIILLGCEKIGVHDEVRNPYTYQQRRDMIAKIFPQVWFVPIFDHDSDHAWSDRVDELVEGWNPILYHSRDSFKEHYKGTVLTKEVEEIPGYSGTQLRESLKDGRG